jgi:hypothetical protein
MTHRVYMVSMKIIVCIFMERGLSTIQKYVHATNCKDLRIKINDHADDADTWDSPFVDQPRVGELAEELSS